MSKLFTSEVGDKLWTQVTRKGWLSLTFSRAVMSLQLLWPSWCSKADAVTVCRPSLRDSMKSCVSMQDRGQNAGSSGWDSRGRGMGVSGVWEGVLGGAWPTGVPVPGSEKLWKQW